MFLPYIICTENAVRSENSFSQLATKKTIFYQPYSNHKALPIEILNIFLILINKYILKQEKFLSLNKNKITRKTQMYLAYLSRTFIKHKNIKEVLLEYKEKNNQILIKPNNLFLSGEYTEIEYPFLFTYIYIHSKKVSNKIFTFPAIKGDEFKLLFYSSIFDNRIKPLNLNLSFNKYNLFKKYFLCPFHCSAETLTKLVRFISRTFNKYSLVLDKKHKHDNQNIINVKYELLTLPVYPINFNYLKNGKIFNLTAETKKLYNENIIKKFFNLTNNDCLSRQYLNIYLKIMYITTPNKLNKVFEKVGFYENKHTLFKELSWKEKLKIILDYNYNIINSASYYKKVEFLANNYNISIETIKKILPKELLAYNPYLFGYICRQDLKEMFELFI